MGTHTSTFRTVTRPTLARPSSLPSRTIPVMETLLLERDELLPGLVTITLNRPDKLNAISFTMHQEIQAACRELADDPDARVVILTGAGQIGRAHV